MPGYFFYHFIAPPWAWGAPHSDCLRRAPAISSLILILLHLALESTPLFAAPSPALGHWSAEIRNGSTVPQTIALTASQQRAIAGLQAARPATNAALAAAAAWTYGVGWENPIGDAIADGDARLLEELWAVRYTVR